MYIDLRKVGEISVEAQGTTFDLAHLEEELIAREGQDLEALVFVLLIDGGEALIRS